ncbi:unnamed protein product [Caenorhabditis nigoni]
MPTVQWMQLETVTQKVCGVISVLSNTLLMFLILTKSPKKLGTYKWLMLYTSMFEFFYACISFFVGPSIDTRDSIMIAFEDMHEVWVSHKTAEIFILVYCSCFGSSLSFFAVHFMYRYGAVNLDFKQKYISGAKQVFLYIGPLACGIFWGFNCWLLMSASQMKTDYMRGYLKEKFGLKIEECAYIGLVFWPPARNGNVHPDPEAFIGCAVMWLILCTSFLSVFYFGYNCYRWISKQLGSMTNQSEASKSLQVQLFYALIVQAAIPCFLLYLPAATLFTCPMVNINLNLKYPFMGVTIAIYPAIDPLPNILIIKSYRQGCIEILKCGRKNQIVAAENSQNALNNSRQSVPNLSHLLTMAAV